MRFYRSINTGQVFQVLDDNEELKSSFENDKYDEVFPYLSVASLSSQEISINFEDEIRIEDTNPLSFMVKDIELPEGFSGFIRFGTKQEIEVVKNKFLSGLPETQTSAKRGKEVPQCRKSIGLGETLSNKSIMDSITNS